MRIASLVIAMVFTFTIGFLVGYAQSRLDTLRDCARIITVNGAVEIAGAGDEGYRKVSR